MEPRRRVLVVDDSEDIRELYEMLLLSAGYEVQTASDGARGFERARTWRPDVVILDVVMPVMDGLELLLKLRSDLVPPIPPVILCSGFDLTETEALRRGAVSFLRKPTDNGDLVRAIEEALRGEAPAPERERRQRDHASAARERTLAAAGELIRRIEAHGTHGGPSLATLRALVQSRIETLAAFIGIARAAIALVRGGRLEVLAATEPAALAPGFDLGAAVPQACEVLETGSSLLLPDASAHPFSSVSRSLGGIRFFAGVPLRVGGIPVGVVCLFDPSVQRLEGEELAALERFGRRGSDLLLRFAEAGDADRLIQRRGLVVREMFEELLDAELHILDRRGGSMELAVLDVRDLAAVEAAIARAASPARLLAAVLSSTRVALFKRALDDSARRQVAAIVDDLRARGELRALGIVDLPDGGVRGFAAGDLVRVAAIALDRALDRGDGLRRVVIEEEHAT